MNRAKLRKLYTAMDNETGAAMLDAIMYGEPEAVLIEVNIMRGQLDKIAAQCGPLAR